MWKVNTLVAVLSIPLLIAGCEDDVLGPDMQSVAGTYTATEFTITTGSGAEDLLTMGGSIVVTLAADGTTSGSVFVPSVGGAGELDASLDGTWQLAGRTITFSHAADTFLRDMTFRYTDQGTITGDEVFANALIEVVLER